MPLKGIKVLDFTRLLPGPFGTLMLADLGCEVLRIEAPGGHDLTRSVPPRIGTSSWAYEFLSRGKKVKILDFKSQDARAEILEIVKEFDVVVEGFRPGVMAKWGFDYESFRAIKPDLIYVSLTGYGQTGPYKDRAGHDINFQALAGLASYGGTPSQPIVSSFQSADVAGGSSQLAIGVLTALVHKYRTGEGQFLDISMTDALVYLQHFHVASALGGIQPRRGAEILNGGSFYGYFATFDDEFFSVGSLEPVFLERLLGAVGLLQWVGRSIDGAAMEELCADLARVFKQKTRAQWQELFQSCDCAVEPVLSLGEALKSPLSQERGWVVPVRCSDGVVRDQIAFPIKFSTLKPRFSS